MTAEADKIASEILSLPASVRAFLAHRLISSLEEDVDENSEIEWAAEIDRRSQEIADGKVVCRPALEAIAEIRGKLNALRRQSSES